MKVRGHRGADPIFDEILVTINLYVIIYSQMFINESIFFQLLLLVIEFVIKITEFQYITQL